MTTVESVFNILHRNLWTISLDLKDTYQHIMIHPRMRQLSAFQVGKGTQQFRVMHFQLSILTRIFTRLISMLSTRLMSLKVIVLAYLDVFLIKNSKEECVKQSYSVSDVFYKASFILNVGKIMNCSKSKVHLVQDQQVLPKRFASLSKRKVSSLFRRNCCYAI